MSAQQYGPLLEYYIRKKYDYSKTKKDDCQGDCSKNGQNLEIKVSLATKKFNFVQIRPSHDCDIYIFTAYYLSQENVDDEGELFIFKVPKEEIIKIIASYGGYAHGTIKEYGEITIESITNGKSKEYSLRPIFNDDCWKALMFFQVPETAL